jgi:uncharacterized membrane protein
LRIIAEGGTFQFMKLLRILSVLVGAAAVIGAVLAVFMLLWWLILPIVAFFAGALLLGWGMDKYNS